MHIVLFGATGTIGKGVLAEALDSPHVTEVLSIGRKASGVDHPKLRELQHEDFTDFAPIANQLSGLDACFWCLGISSAGMDEATYTRITYDFTMAAARTLREQSPQLCFCFVSGAGTDASEGGRSMWARVKGRTENALRKGGFREAVMFRPAFVQPTRGGAPSGALYRVLNLALAPLFPLLRMLGGATSNAEIGRAMIAAAHGRAPADVLDSRAINALAADPSLREATSPS